MNELTERYARRDFGWLEERPATCVVTIGINEIGLLLYEKMIITPADIRLDLTEELIAHYKTNKRDLLKEAENMGYENDGMKMSYDVIKLRLPSRLIAELKIKAIYLNMTFKELTCLLLLIRYGVM